MSSIESQLSKKKYFDSSLLAYEMETRPFSDKDVIEAFRSLVEKLGEKLSTYDTMLSDDASGHLISLVLREIINEARKKTGLESIKTYFLASGRHDSDVTMQKIQTFLEGKRPDIKKALLVTEFISSGRSIEKLTTILDALKIPFDLASLSIDNEPNSYGAQIYSRLNYGQKSRVGMAFFGQTLLTGIEKNAGGGTPHPIKDKVNLRAAILATRRDVKKLAKVLISLIDEDKK